MSETEAKTDVAEATAEELKAQKRPAEVRSLLLFDVDST